jgi:hypothetical protein
MHLEGLWKGWFWSSMYGFFFWTGVKGELEVDFTALSYKLTYTGSCYRYGETVVGQVSVDPDGNPILLQEDIKIYLQPFELSPDKVKGEYYIMNPADRGSFSLVPVSCV